jgi:hypothetical protein
MRDRKIIYTMKVVIDDSTTTRAPFLARPDTSVAMGTIVMAVLPHVIGRTVLTTFVLGHAMTRILGIHPALNLGATRSALLVNALGVISNRLIVWEGSGLSVLDILVDLN